MFGCDLRYVPFINPVTCPLTHQEKKKKKKGGIEAVEEGVPWIDRRYHSDRLLPTKRTDTKQGD